MANSTNGHVDQHEIDDLMPWNITFEVAFDDVKETMQEGFQAAVKYDLPIK